MSATSARKKQSEAGETLLRIYGRNVDVAAFKRGWTQTTLAKKLDVSITCINRLRTGRNRYIEPDVLIKLAQLFKCSFDELLNEQEGVDYSHE